MIIPEESFASAVYIGFDKSNPYTRKRGSRPGINSILVAAGFSLRIGGFPVASGSPDLTHKLS